jgi:hypothetical protein
MTFEEAKGYLREKKKMARENWAIEFYVEVADDLQPNRRLRLVDSCGREYAVSAADESATDWIFFD